MIRIEYAPGRARGEGRLAEALVRRTARVVSKALRLKGSFVVSIALVDAPSMHRLNKAFRGKDAVTDVLSFTYGEREMFGEILICPSQARKQARSAKRSLKKEMLELLVHGLLHVFGYDHLKPQDARVMLPLQERLLKNLV